MIDSHPEFVAKLADYKGPNGELLFSPREINRILYDCKYQILTEPKKIFEVLDNPNNINHIFSHSPYTSAGLSGIVRPYINYKTLNHLKNSLIQSLKEAPPKYDVTVVKDMIDRNPDFLTKLSEYKTPDGKQMFNPSEINDILFNCKDVIEGSPNRVFSAIDTNLTDFYNSKNKAVDLWIALYR